MNNARRKEISKLISEMEDILSRLETLRDEEQEVFDNMPQSFQDGEKGEKVQEAVGYLEDAVANAESIREALENAIE